MSQSLASNVEISTLKALYTRSTSFARNLINREVVEGMLSRYQYLFAGDKDFPKKFE